MAKKKVVEEAQPEVTTPVDISETEATKWIFKQAMQDSTLGVPVLLGPTHWGKTYLGNQTGREIYPRVLTSNLQLDLPEEIGGYPINRDGRIEYCDPPLLPRNWQDGNFLLFFDELDKARWETLSCVLSLFAERRIRQCFLPKNVGIAAAMNEPQSPLPEPLITRMLFLRWPPKEYRLSERDDFKMWGRATELHPIPEVRFPEIPSSPAILHKLTKWAKFPEFHSSAITRSLIINGLAPPNLVPGYESLFKIDETVTGSDWAMKLPIDYIIANLIPLCVKAEQLKDYDLECLGWLRERAAIDETGELLRVIEGVLGPHGNLLAESFGCPEVVEENQKKFLQYVAELKEGAK